MKLQVFSDLHVDVAKIKPIAVAKGVDAVVVAGDVCEGAREAFVELRAIVPLEVPIVFTIGNHELYGSFYADELALARAAAPDYNLVLLEYDAVTLPGSNVRFVGATAWTDYRIFGDHTVAAAMNAARNGMNDHKRIGWRKVPWERFRPQEAVMLHAKARSFFAEALAVQHDGPVVVVTHHAPSFRSVAERFTNDILTAAFASSLADDLLHVSPTAGRPSVSDGAVMPPRVDYWFHGHVHNSCDYFIGGTRIIANPHGYGRENPSFDSCLVVEIGE
jgi:Icc-related predicted phosphoesterase